MNNPILRYWYKASIWDLPIYLFFIVPLLILLSLLYRFFIVLRAYSYRWGIQTRQAVKVPVIVVGNITVGGTGKSPLVRHLCEYLLDEGWRPGIISRGYKGAKNHLPQWVSSQSDPYWVGDEPVMLAKQTACPVVVCRDRVKAAKVLLEQSDCNVIISDDGLQHHALHRDIEIAVMRADRPYGNGCCLPLGPLREPISRLNNLDFICINGESTAHPFLLTHYKMHYHPGDIYQIVNTSFYLEGIARRDSLFHAVAGIASPDSFFALLREQGFTIIEHAFPDHHVFRSEDIDFGFESQVIMTEKDAVKCRSFADDRHWCLPISLAVDPLFLKNLQKKLQSCRH